jgi:hypothetical protein
MSVISLLELAQCCLQVRACLPPQLWNLLEPLRYTQVKQTLCPFHVAKRLSSSLEALV